MHDNDKNVIEQIIDQVNDLVENIANSVSDALDQAEPAVLDRQSVPSPENTVQGPIEPPAFDETNENARTDPTKAGLARGTGL